jgi:N-formylglutamate amidohydrolase
LSLLHRPYHAEIQRILARKLERFGIAVLLAAHSMPSHARFATGEIGPARADVVPGTRGRSSADGRFIDAVEAHAVARGWSVKHDDPYRGGYTTAHYGRPAERVHALQVELARRLYMDEERLSLSASAQDVRNWCRALVAKLGELALR